MAVSFNVFDIFDFVKYCNFEIRVRATRGRQNYHSIDCGFVLAPYSNFVSINALFLNVENLR